jgi:hypothetical protein
MGGGRGYFPVVAAAFFLNTVLPFRAGEAARAYWSHRRSGRSLSGLRGRAGRRSVGGRPRSPRGVRRFPFSCRGSDAGIENRGPGFRPRDRPGRLGVGVRWPETVRKKLLPGGSPALWVRIVEGVLAGVAPLRAGRIALGVGALSGMVWTLNVFLYWWVAGLFGIDLSLPQAGGVLAAIALGVALPSTPGFVGVYEAAGVLMLGSLGIEKERALAFVLALHARANHRCRASGAAPPCGCWGVGRGMPPARRPGLIKYRDRHEANFNGAPGRIFGCAAAVLLAAGLRAVAFGWGLPLKYAHIDESVVSFYAMRIAAGVFNPGFYDYPGLFLNLLAGFFRAGLALAGGSFADAALRYAAGDSAALTLTARGLSFLFALGTVAPGVSDGAPMVGGGCGDVGRDSAGGQPLARAPQPLRHRRRPGGSFDVLDNGALGGLSRWTARAAGLPGGGSGGVGGGG